MKKPEVDAISAPFIGTGFFMGRPKYWFFPLLTVFFSFLVLVSLLIGITWYLWPVSDHQMTHYIFHIFKALGIASLIALLLWVFLFTFVLNLAFQQMIRKAYYEVEVKLHEEGIWRAAISSIAFFKRTLFWRFFWPLAALILTFLAPPMSYFVSQLAIGHMAVIDGFDLSLSLKGLPGEKRFHLYKSWSLQLFIMGMVAGIGSFFLFPTLILWAFWIPGVYIGAAFYTIRDSNQS